MKLKTAYQVFPILIEANRRFDRRLSRTICLMAVLAVCLSLSGSAVLASPVEYYNMRPDSSFDGQIDLTGGISVVGGGNIYDAKAKAVTSFSVTPPTYHPMVLTGGPVNVNAAASNNDDTLFGLDASGAPIAFSNITADLLSGQTAPFAVDTVHVTTNSTVPIFRDITLDLNGEIDYLKLLQNGAVTFTPLTADHGTFSMDVKLVLGFPNVTAQVLEIIETYVPGTIASGAGVFSGTYDVSPASSAQPGSRIVLDGELSAEVPIHYEVDAYGFSITDPAQITVSSTIDYIYTVGVSGHVRLDYLTAIPEPGSATLLVLGIAVLISRVKFSKR